MSQIRVLPPRFVDGYALLLVKGMRWGLGLQTRRTGSAGSFTCKGGGRANGRDLRGCGHAWRRARREAVSLLIRIQKSVNGVLL